jgi:hypothetical protein
MRRVWLILSLCLLLPHLLWAAEPRIALVIGNGRYSSSPLINPPNDAQLVGDTLSKLGFEVIARRNSDQAGMKRAIQEFGERLERAGPDAVGLFYYAGHGVQLNGRNYLIPVSANIERDADVDIEAVSADWVMEQMRYARNRLNIVILDACRNNPFVRSLRSADRGLAKMDAPAGVMIAYSTAPGDVAADGSGRNSPYSEALAKAMLEPNQPIEQVFKRTRISVIGATKSRQTPWESSSLTGDFYFSATNRPATSPAAAPAALPAAPIALRPSAAPPAGQLANAKKPSVAPAPPAAAPPATASRPAAPPSRVASIRPAPVTSAGAPSAQAAKSTTPVVTATPAPQDSSSTRSTQSNSRGGLLGVFSSIGHTAKRVVTRGSKDSPSPATADERENFCRQPVGQWKMAGNHVKGAVQINVDHSMSLWKSSRSPAVKGSWNCDASSQRFTFVWSYGSTETVVLSSANRVLQGTDQHDYQVTYKRSR